MVKVKISKHIPIAIKGLLYAKILKVSPATNKRFKKGQINNLIGSHTRRVKALILRISSFCNTPFSMVATSYSLHCVIGNIYWYVLGILVINAGVTYLFTQYFVSMYRKSMKSEDKRSNLITEIVENIMIIKMNSWVKCFLEKLNEIRTKEFYLMAKRSLIRVPHNIFNNFSQYGVIVIVFWMLITRYNMSISVSSSIAIMRILKRLKISTGELPRFVRIYSKFIPSINIIEDFLLLEELQDCYSRKDNNGDGSILVKPSNFFWGFDHIFEESIEKHSKKENPKKSNHQKKEIDLKNQSLSLENKICLKSIHLNIKKGEFVAIIGDVGAGKSSLLSCILGEMLYIDQSIIDKYKDVVLDFKNDPENAKAAIQPINIESKEKTLKIKDLIQINGRVSLVEQKPFILSKTIRDNILFGEELIADRYNHVIHICQLGRDIEILEGGDLTEIGERGINLSGGQKARISIARAVYSNSDIVLMDDPLSALDAHVKRKIFDDVCCKELANKTRLLVTHAVDFLDKVDRIVVVEKGHIILDGSFEQLKHEIYFNKIIQSMIKVNSDSSQDQTKTKTPSIHKDYLSKNGTKIIKEEEKENIKYDIISYLSFIKSAFVITLFILLCMIGSKLITMKKEYFLIKWIKDISQDINTGYNGMLFIIVLTIVLILIDLAKSLLQVLQNYIIDKKLFSDMIDKVLNASIPLYFNRTSSGYILNRFSNDIDVCSQELSEAIIGNIKEICVILITIGIVAYNALFCVLLVPLSGMLFVYTVKKYIDFFK